MINYRSLLLLLVVAFRGNVYAQTLTEYNTFEGVSTTKNVIDICSKSWDTAYMFTFKDYFYVDTTCIFKRPKICLENIKSKKIPVLIDENTRDILLGILSSHKTYLSSEKVGSNSVVFTTCNNEIEYNVFFVFKNQTGSILIFYCSQKDNNYSLLYQSDRVTYILWNSCMNYNAHDRIFSDVVMVR